MRAYPAVMGCLLTVALAACATVSTTTTESQSRQRDPRLARLYFIWPRGLMLKTGTVDIKVNGEVVGKIAPESYFFIDRKPGTYTLGVEPGFDFTYFEADAPVTAGRTYYYSVNVSPTPLPHTGGLAIQGTPTTGTAMQAKSGVLASYRLGALDATGAAAIMRDLDTR